MKHLKMTYTKECSFRHWLHTCQWPDWYQSCSCWCTDNVLACIAVSFCWFWLREEEKKKEEKEEEEDDDDERRRKKKE